MAASELTGQSIVTAALEEIGAYGVGQTLQASDANKGLRKLNAMISSLGIQSLARSVVAREVFSVTANVGTYTIGAGATFNTARPVNIAQANALQTNVSPTIEIPLGIMTEQMWQNTAIKDQTGTMFTWLHYEPTYTTSGFGTINLWPVPTTTTYRLVLYLPQTLVQFANLTTEYFWPDGSEEMLVYNLALRLCAPYARPVPDDVRRLARESLAVVKRNNTVMADLSNDFAAIGDRRYGYNINTDA